MNTTLSLNIRKARANQRGLTLPMLALFIVVLFAFAAMAVDLGVLFTARTSAQHAADAAALAGAFTFVENPLASDDEIKAKAMSIAARSAILGTPVSIAPENVTVERDLQRVTVTVPRTAANGVETFFAKVIGYDKVDVQVRATAEAAKTTSATYCLKPFYAPLDLKDCSGPSILDKNSPDGLSDVGRAMVGQPIDPYLWSNIAPSQWGLLAINGRGERVLYDNISQCLTTQVKCGEEYEVEPGRGGQDIVKAVNDFLTDDGAYTPPDTWVNVGAYAPHGDTATKPMATSRSLASVVIWKCDPAVLDALAHGRPARITVEGFAEVFIDNTFKSGSTGGVRAHFVKAGQCEGSGGSEGGGAGPFAVPVRLIQTPLAMD